MPFVVLPVPTLAGFQANCQQWSSRRFEMMAEDGKHLVEDGQKFMTMGARLLSNGWATKNASGGSSARSQNTE
jgi:hypothetical protein